MKIWTKLLIGSFLGIILGAALSADNQTVLGALNWIEALAIGIGRYAVVPILFFSLSIAVFELRQDGQFWPLLIKTFAVIFAAAFLIIPLGILVVTVFRPGRIPFLFEEQREAISLNVQDNILELFPSNMFSALTGDGVYLLPVCVFAFFFGIGLSFERKHSKHVSLLVDSLSRVFYQIASFFSEIMGIIMIALAAYWAVRFRNVLNTGVFGELVLLLGIFSLILGLGILPLIIYFLKPKCNPWTILYGSLGQAIASFFSGDINFTLPVLFRHLKENAGCRRRSSTVTTALFVIFGRAGSAMVAVITFFVITRSYVYSSIAPSAIISVGLHAVLVSFLLAGHPRSGAYAALAVICMRYGQGTEVGYLIIKPMAFFLIAVGTFLDIMIATFGSFVLARISGFQEDKQINNFI